MNEYKNQVEAVLFAAGKKLPISEIAKLCRTKNLPIIEEALKELSVDYEQKGGSLLVFHEGDNWKLTVREKYLTNVQKIVADTELTKTVMETLSVVAYKAPCLQSDIIHIRTNKAYDHLDQLETMGYLKRIKSGRTKKIMLTQHFYDYFDITEENLKKTFDGSKPVEDLIKAKEEELLRKAKKQNPESHSTTEHESTDANQEGYTTRKEDILEKKPQDKHVALETSQGVQELEVYASERQAQTEAPTVEVLADKVGQLDVVDSLPTSSPTKAKNEESFDNEEQPPEETPVEDVQEQTETLNTDSQENQEVEEEEKELPHTSSIEQMIEQRATAIATQRGQTYEETNSLISLAQESAEADEADAKIPILLVKCPKCNNTMKYQPLGNSIHSKIKRCVYCGHSINVEKNWLQPVT